MQKLFENFRTFLNEANDIAPPEMGQKFKGMRGEILDLRHDPNLKSPEDWLTSAQARGETRGVSVNLNYEENYDSMSGEKLDRSRWVLRVRVGPTAGTYHGLSIPELAWNWQSPKTFRRSTGRYSVRGREYNLPPHLNALWQAQAIQEAEIKMIMLDKELQDKIKEKSKDLILKKEIDIATKKLRTQRALLESFRKIFKSSVPSLQNLHAIAGGYFEAMKKMDMDALERDLNKPRGDDFEDVRSSRVGDSLDKRFWKRVGDEGANINRIIAQVTENPEAYLGLYFDKIKIDDPIVSKAKRIGWEKLSRLERKLVRNRLVSLQLVRDLKLMNRKNPIIKNIDVLDDMVEAWEELEELRLNLEDLSEEGSREMTVANKKPDKNWFKRTLKKLPFFGSFFATALFPYDDAYAAYIRGLERKAGIRKEWDGRTSMSVGGAVQTLAGMPLVALGDSQAELHSLILLEIARSFDPGVELTELMIILANKYGPEVGEWLMKGRRYFGPSKEDIEDYPELRRQYEPDVRTGAEEEDIGPVPPEDLQEMKTIFENWRGFRKGALNEVSDYEIFRKQKRNPYTGEKMSYPAERLMRDMAPAKQVETVRIMMSFFDPSQISSWPDIPPAYKAWEKNPSVWNTSLLLLALTAAIPVAGKFAKIAKPGLKVALKRAKIDATIALKNSKADVSDALKHITGQTKKVNLSDQSRLLQSVNWARREMDPDHELYDNLVALRKRERYGELRRSTDFKTLGWRNPDVMLKGLRLIKIKTPKVVYHGGAKGINKNNLKVASRSGHRNIIPGTQAGFYTTADTESAKFFKSSRAGEKGQLYKIQIDPKANVYQLPDKFVRKDAGLAHMSVTDQKELFNQGVQGLWDPKSKDLVIFDKSIVLDMNPI